MRDLKNISSELFNKIRTRFDNVRLGDEKSKSTTDPEKARFFNFDYTVDGHKVGNITVSLIDERSLKLYYGRDILEAIKEIDTIGDTQDGVSNEQKWYNFLRSIRQFAKRNLLTFDTRDITKSNLQVKDVKQQSKADDTLSTDEMNVTESRMFGTKRSSYQECGPVRIIVRHQGDVNDEIRGARGRNIDSIFLETHLGERFLCPIKNLHIARALAQHLSQGGEIQDEIGSRIALIGEEMDAMRHFVREVKRRQFEDKETDSMARAAVRRYDELKGRLKHLAGRRGYDDYRQQHFTEESFDDIDVDSLRERFVKKVYNEKFDAALPYVYKAYMKQKQEGIESPMGNQFEDWANEVAEGAWQLPTDEQDTKKLDELMAKKLEAGENGENATGAVSDIIGDDVLYDKLADVASAEGPETDARPTIIQWLRDNGYAELADKYEQNYTQDDTGMQQQPDAVAAQQTQANAGEVGQGGNQMQPAANTGAPMQESDLGWLRKLSGLK